MQMLCCLDLLGEISSEDRIILEQHLLTCTECREFLKDMEQIVLCDLAATAAFRTNTPEPQNLELTNENKLFAKIMEEIKHHKSLMFVPACPISFPKRVMKICQRAYPIIGWAVAALIIFAWGLNLKKTAPITTSREIAIHPSSESFQRAIDSWKAKALLAEKQKQTVQLDLNKALTQAQNSALQLAHFADKYQALETSEYLFRMRAAQQTEELHQQAAVISQIQTNLGKERNQETFTQMQLQESNALLDKQREEITHLREVAASASARMPIPVHDVYSANALDILGARDLHIVDVYDIDHDGKASLTYGRIYYINQELLLFYAFDLGHNSAKNRKAVAFQAWGFHQPNSKTAESLGLFYLDDAKLDRWALRISDPHLLSRIDTLFVTVEPPGGSATPKGHQLLLASLAGPPNHP